MYRVSIIKLKMIYLSFIIYDLISEQNEKLERILFLPYGSEYFYIYGYDLQFYQCFQFYLY